jgi:flagella basal body P-ring formation protein FlgA
VTQGTIHLSIEGTALADGSLGDTLYIRLDARRRIRAIVGRDGTVTAIALPPR